MSGIYPGRLTTPAAGVDLARLSDDLATLYEAESNGVVTDLALRDSVVGRTSRIDATDWWTIIVELFPIERDLDDLDRLLSWIRDSPIWTETEDVAEALPSSTPPAPDLLAALQASLSRAKATR